jgi:hypothetical protein
MEKQQLDGILQKIGKDYDQFRSESIRTSAEIRVWISEQITNLLNKDGESKDKTTLR